MKPPRSILSTNPRSCLPELPVVESSRKMHSADCLYYDPVLNQAPNSKAFNTSQECKLLKGTDVEQRKTLLKKMAEKLTYSPGMDNPKYVLCDFTGSPPCPCYRKR